MSFYEQTEKSLRLGKLSKQGLNWEHKIILLAIAREADKRQMPECGIQATEQELLELSNEEIIYQLDIIARKLISIIAEGEIHEVEVCNFLLNAKKAFGDADGLEILERLHDMHKQIKKSHLKSESKWLLR